MRVPILQEARDGFFVDALGLILMASFSLASDLGRLRRLRLRGLRVKYGAQEALMAFVDQLILMYGRLLQTQAEIEAQRLRNRMLPTMMLQPSLRVLVQALLVQVSSLRRLAVLPRLR